MNKMDYLIFPSDYFDTKQIEAEYFEEYQACPKDVKPLIFDYEKMFEENRLVFDQSNLTSGKAIYRGWMMTPTQYQSFYNQLKEIYQIELLTTPENYTQFHLFPNIYPYLSEDTPKILTFPLGVKVDIESIRCQMAEFMIKDYVKSAKGTKLPNQISANISQQELDKYLNIFYQYRGDLLTEGICIKEFVKLNSLQNQTNEYRVFYAKGEIISITQSVYNTLFSTQPPKDLIEKYKNLPSPFYTIDFAELSDGTWIVLEAGDGQVSGLSDHQDREEFIEKLTEVLKNKR